MQGCSVCVLCALACVRVSRAYLTPTADHSGAALPTDMYRSFRQGNSTNVQAVLGTLRFKTSAAQNVFEGLQRAQLLESTGASLLWDANLSYGFNMSKPIVQVKSCELFCCCCCC